MSQPHMSLKERILKILNEDLSPWVFDGSEPMAERIVNACGEQSDFCTCGHYREAHHVWGKCHGAGGCKCTAFVLNDGPLICYWCGSYPALLCRNGDGMMLTICEECRDDTWYMSEAATPPGPLAQMIEKNLKALGPLKEADKARALELLNQMQAEWSKP